MSRLFTVLVFVIVFCVDLTNLIYAGGLLAHASALGKLGRKMTKVIGCGLFGVLCVVASCGLFAFCLERLVSEQGPMALCPDLVLGLLLCMFETLVWDRCFPMTDEEAERAQYL